MTPDEAAAQLNNCQYREEGDASLFKRMKESGLVAVYGASDDLMEFNGAITDEVGCYGGGEAYVTKEGLLQSECDDDDCPYFEKIKLSASRIEAVWDDDSGFSWVYETAIPHVTFEVMEDDEPYCRGIVFALKDVGGAA